MPVAADIRIFLHEDFDFFYKFMKFYRILKQEYCKQRRECIFAQYLYLWAQIGTNTGYDLIWCEDELL